MVTMIKEKPDLKDKILDSAETVIVRQGVANLILDSVAAEAGISKGGLLHHFPSKDSLIAAMVRRSAECWRRGVMDAYEGTPEGPGRMVRAMLNHCLSDVHCTTHERRSSIAIFAALAQSEGCPECDDSSLMEPMKNVYSELYDRVKKDGLPPGVGEAAVAAIDGLWLYWVLGLVPVNQELVSGVRRAIENMVAHSISASKGARRAPLDAGRKPSAPTYKGSRRKQS